MCHVVARMEAPCSPRAAAPDLAPLDSHNGSSKILGRNSNGTMIVTAPPGNEAELQLYRVLQRASLLAYYDTLLEMGGDDVQQLCDAGEAEFLEIMALVGMASKPLHVRRFQKALQEWVTNPSIFQIPIVPNLCPSDTSFLSCSPRLPNMTPTHSTILQRPTVASPESNRPMYSPSPGIPESSCGSNSSAPNASPVHNSNNSSKTTATATSTTTNQPSANNSRSYSPVQGPTCPPSSGSSPSSVNCSPVQMTPCLLEIQIQRLAAAAERLSKHLPQLEPKPQNTKKKMCKDLEAVLIMPENDPRRMEEIRKYAAIYGRFDCKRKPEKPLTLHEVSVNEAAAQMCRAVPALLTRRDELFPLARQVVRLSGFHYSKGNSQITSTCTGRSRSESDGGSGGSGGAKRIKGEPGNRSERGESTPGQDKTLGDENQQRGCEIENDIENSRHHYTSSSGIWSRVDSDDGDSRYSFSNSSSPTIQDQDECRTENEADVTIKENRVRIVAASGDHIIAVANPALALSRSIMAKRESGSSLEDN